MKNIRINKHTLCGRAFALFRQSINIQIQKTVPINPSKGAILSIKSAIIDMVTSLSLVYTSASSMFRRFMLDEIKFAKRGVMNQTRTGSSSYT